MQSFLQLLREQEHERKDREAIRTQAHVAEVGGLRTTIDELKATLEEKERELDEQRHREELADATRDMRIDGLEEFKVEASPFIKALSKETAPEVARINKPGTEATATAATATALNKARFADYAWKLALTLAAIVLAIIQALNAKQGEPTQSIPVPTVKQANPSNPAGMP
jgi:hypothetical protein